MEYSTTILSLGQESNWRYGVYEAETSMRSFLRFYSLTFIRSSKTLERSLLTPSFVTFVTVSSSDITSLKRFLGDLATPRPPIITPGSIRLHFSFI